jgi:hypothetical protein
LHLERKAVLAALHDGERTDRQKLLLCLANLGPGTFSVAQVKEQAHLLGFSRANRINVSAELNRSNGKAFHTPTGWELNPTELAAFQLEFGPNDGPLVKSASTLRKHLAQLISVESKTFVEEAIGCVEHKFHRAAVVLSWVGALHVLQAAVLSTHQSAFNAEALRRQPKWRAATNPEDISQMKEVDFLDVLSSIGFLDANVKKSLKSCLDLRNSCGHPNTLKIDDHVVSSHVEILSLNVFSKY